MKKQELIHLHGLLVTVRDRYEARTGRTLDLQEYESGGVYPTSIHRSKTMHKEAVFSIADGLTDEFAETDERVTPRVD